MFVRCDILFSVIRNALIVCFRLLTHIYKLKGVIICITPLIEIRYIHRIDIEFR